MKTVYENASKSLRIVHINSDWLDDYENEYMIYSYNTPIAKIYTNETDCTVSIPQRSFSFSTTTTRHIAKAIGWAIVKFGNPIVDTDHITRDMTFNAPRKNWIIDGANINGVKIEIIK